MIKYLSRPSAQVELFFNGFATGIGKCMTRTVDSPEDAQFSKTITIEYDGACSPSFNDVGKGRKIIITLTDHPCEEGSQRMVTSEDFTVNGNVIRGTKTYTYIGNGQFTCMLKDGYIITKNGDVIIRESIKSRT